MVVDTQTDFTYWQQWLTKWWKNWLTVTFTADNTDSAVGDNTMHFHCIVDTGNNDKGLTVCGGEGLRVANYVFAVHFVLLEELMLDQGELSHVLYPEDVWVYLKVKSFKYTLTTSWKHDH